MTLKIGLTGGIASGKSQVCQLFADAGANTLEADEIVRTLSNPGTSVYQDIISRFGQTMTLADGQLNRPVLRELIFQDADARRDLENIIHPAVSQELATAFAESKARVTIAAVPLLIEANMQHLFDRILLISIRRPIQLQRLLQREAISETLAQRMIDAQIDDQQRLHYADDMIDNNGKESALTEQVQQLFAYYESLAANLTHVHMNRVT